MPKSLMATLVALITAFVVLTFAGGAAYAKSISEQQVNNVCGKALESGSAGNQKAMGCEKKCGKQLCTYGCVGPKNQKGYARCDAVVLGPAAGGGRKIGWQQVVQSSRAGGMQR